jgi:hypothetical protein
MNRQLFETLLSIIRLWIIWGIVVGVFSILLFIIFSGKMSLPDPIFAIVIYAGAGIFCLLYAGREILRNLRNIFNPVVIFAIVFGGTLNWVVFESVKTIYFFKFQ